jgi:hypothetical protein
VKTPQKCLKTPYFHQAFAMRPILDSHTPKHYGPRGFLGRQEHPGFA